MSDEVELLQRLKSVRTMPELDAMRPEVAKAMIGNGKETFERIQTAFRKAKNRLQCIPLRDRTW